MLCPTVMKPLTLWLLGDGKPGHENQSLGLADALSRRMPCEIHRISMEGKNGLLSGKLTDIGMPKPDFLIGAGHATHFALLRLTRKHRARSIVLMRPSLPLRWFDLCIIPAHDFADRFERENVILTRGALNRVTLGSGEKTGKLILIGGPSKTHGWDSGRLLGQLAEATDRAGWELSDSRRTPVEFMEQARACLPGVTVVSHRDTPPEWVPEKLRCAKEVWVTEDSVSMIYEALTSGARVGVLPVPRIRQRSRVLKGIDQLAEEGYITRFSRWQEDHCIGNAPEVLSEADRCADEVRERFSL